MTTKKRVKPNLTDSPQRRILMRKVKSLQVESSEQFRSLREQHSTKQSKEECVPENPISSGKNGKMITSQSESQPTTDWVIVLKLRSTTLSPPRPYITEA